jgi:hypothetical protein
MIESVKNGRDEGNRPETNNVELIVGIRFEID